MFSASDVASAAKRGLVRIWKFVSSRPILKGLEVIIPLASAIIAGISAYASYLAADAARDQAQSSRESLNTSQRNELFLKYFDSVNAFCFALDVSQNADSHNAYSDENGMPVAEFSMSQLYGVSSADLDAHIAAANKSFRDINYSVQRLYGWLDDEADQQVYRQAKMLNVLGQRSDLMNYNHSILVRSWLEQAQCQAIQSAILAWYRLGAAGAMLPVTPIDQTKIRLYDLGTFPTVVAALDSLALSNGIAGMSDAEITALETPHSSR